MSDIVSKDWVPLLQRLNSLMLRSGRFEIAEEVLSRGWCGQPPAPESEIIKAEMRLGVKFPPSYRAFLSISNGWFPFNGLVQRLLPVQQIDHFRILDPEQFASMEKSHAHSLELYGGEVVSDEVYFDYETPAHNVAMRMQYYGNSLLISQRLETELVLLNPFIVSADGEWETIFSAHWIPGNERFRSFREFVEKFVRDEEEAEANRLPNSEQQDGPEEPPLFS